jgi:hypothetical protein
MFNRSKTQKKWALDLQISDEFVGGDGRRGMYEFVDGPLSESGARLGWHVVWRRRSGVRRWQGPSRDLGGQSKRQ